MPSQTRFKYVRENFHHRSRNGRSSAGSMQNPWKHSATGDVAIAKSAATVSNFGIRLNRRNIARINAANIIPIKRLFFRSVSNVKIIDHQFYGSCKKVSLFKKTSGIDDYLHKSRLPIAESNISIRPS